MELPRDIAPFILVFLLALSTPLSGEPRTEEAVMDCSLINLVATPERFHGKKVRVIGYAVVEFEQHVLYLSETDADRLISRNGVWLSLDEKAPPGTLKGMNREYAIVVGIFDMNVRGHGAMNSGNIKQIERMDRWVRPEK